jgi:cell wall-associated NlpC family hydrolase
MEAWALPSDFPEVQGDPNATRHSTESVIVPWLDGREEFRRVETGEAYQPGDLLGIRIYRCVDHLALYVGSAVFIHVLMHQKTTTDTTVDPTWNERVRAAWRPLARS